MVKEATLRAMNDMSEADAFRAARAIMRHEGGEFGIEWLPLPTGGEVPYVNTGDTYNNTLLRVDDEWVEACWGDVYEADEEKHANDGNTRCCYCGEWSEGPIPCHDEDGTPIDVDDFDPDADPDEVFAGSIDEVLGYLAAQD